MQILPKLSIGLSLLGLLLPAHPLLAQGPLAPPGPPAPMMKTLQQMEPRTLIENAGYVITVPGSYYLTANLNGGGTLNGIVVQASGVTIDLRGFAIVNCPVGLSAVAGVRSVAVANGSVSACTGAGVDLSMAGQCRLEGVNISNNAGDGASVGDASLVTLCTAAGNGGHGLAVGNGGTVFRCVAQTNGKSGIVIASNCQATENTCTGNGSGAGQAGLMTTGANNRVDGNSANQNNGQGFQINGTGNLVIRNNACSNSAADYVVAAGNNYGQIVLSPGAAFVNANAWANFGCGAQPGGCLSAADCDDGDACTTDSCVASSCVFTPIANCGNTGCTMDSNCNDNNPCTQDTCQGGSCVFSAGANDGMACTDGNACTVSDTCHSGACNGTPLVCDDGNACTTDSCNAVTGCSHTAIPGCGGVCTDGATQACYPGPAGTLGVGACQAGIQTCSGGTWGACLGAVTPGVEVCDGLDNDCDGMVDDGNPGGGTACNTGMLGVCAAGTTACMSGSIVCAGSVSPSAEVCDGLDNDCNGMVDEGASCGAVCGNGILEAGEACDDANTTNGDGCTSSCLVQAGYSCTGSPSVCTATAIYPLVISRAGSGNGTVTSAPAGIYCGAACSANFSSGAMVTLTATADAGSTFAGWSGACAGTGTCIVTMTTATSVMATFALNATSCTTDIQCADGDPCTLDTCQLATGTCTHAVAPDGTACNDGNACTQSRHLPGRDLHR